MNLNQVEIKPLRRGGHGAYLLDSEQGIFVFKSERIRRELPLYLIAYFESQKNYFTVFSVTGDRYRCRGTLKRLESDLFGHGFYRIHSAYIVNSLHVRRVDTEKVELDYSGNLLPVAERRIKYLKNTEIDLVRT